MVTNTLPPKPVAWFIPVEGSPAKRPDAEFIYYEDTGWELSFEWAYELIGCRVIEIVRLPPVGCMYVDENGLLAAIPVLNSGATALYHVANPGADSPIAGNAILIIEHAQMAKDLEAFLSTIAAQ
jgi:hypothetical protein